jgi:serine/threonine-protein kinase
MSLTAGTRLGAYEVLGLLGAGGMGEVYRALDPRLHREVAVKLLPPEFVHDATRLARFEREARLLASLQHPRIAAVHGLEESDGRRFLVMELARGESLDAHIARGPLPVEDALAVARQIAEGLEVAHAQGIVHRDLKPSNVQLGPEGAVKLLDFGLAKALEAEDPGGSGRLSQSPTLSGPMTATGVILGTAGYMSPEQARGRAVDRRTDLWALGCVLYEMLSGRRAFTGHTVSDIVAAVLRAEPEWERLPAALPHGARRLLRRCLEKDPQRRLHDAADARIELEETLEELRGGRSRPLAVASDAGAAVPHRPRRAAGIAILAGIAALAAGLALGRLTAPPSGAAGAPGARSPVHALLAMPRGQYLAGWAWPVLAFSPDGRTLAFVATTDDGPQRLHLYHLDSGRTQLVPDSDAAEGPFFSPDGAFVAFAVDVSGSPRPGQLKKFSLATGLTQTICGIGDYFGGDWLPDGHILFVENPTEGLRRVSSAGGQPETLLSSVRLAGRDEAQPLFFPQVLPGGRAALVQYVGAEFNEAAVLDLVTRELRPLGLGALFARYARSGHLLQLHRDGTLLAAPFDPLTARASGPAVAIARDVALGALAVGAFAASDSGRLAYATGYLRGSGRELLRLVTVAAGGAPRPLPFDPDSYYRFPRVSPEGSRVAAVTWDGGLWVHDLARAARSRLPTGDAGGRDFPVWSRDGTRIVFGSSQGAAGWRLLWQLADGSAGPELLATEGPGEKHPGSVTPDGRSLLFAAYQPTGGFYLVDLEGTALPRSLLASPRSDMPTLSPDGRWLAYDSAESGRWEVYVRSYPDMGGRQQVSTSGGRYPRFTRDARSLFYVAGSRVYSARFEPSPDPRPRVAPPRLFAEIPGLRGFDVMPDGSEVVALVRLPDSGIVSQLQLVLDWPAEIDRPERGR